MDEQIKILYREILERFNKIIWTHKIHLCQANIYLSKKKKQNQILLVFSVLISIIRKTKRCGFPKRKVSKIRKFQKRNVFYLFKHTRGRETQKQPVSLPLVLYIQFKPNIIFTGNQTDSLINVILVNMNITEV